LLFLPFVLATCCQMISYTALYVITSASVHALSSLLQLQLQQLQQIQLFVTSVTFVLYCIVLYWRINRMLAL